MMGRNTVLIVVYAIAASFGLLVHVASAAEGNLNVYEVVLSRVKYRNSRPEQWSWLRFD